METNCVVIYIVLFLVFSYLGATIEHISYYLSKVFSEQPKIKALANPIITGFPLYGICAYFVIIVDTLLEKYHVNHLLIKFAVFGLVITLIEYLAGVYVGAGQDSHVGNLIDAWDYTDEPFNFQGKISLLHFISWGILGLIIIKVYPIMFKTLSTGLHCLE